MPGDITAPSTGGLVLGPDELAYAAKSRAQNTLKGYRSDWNEWT